MSPDSVPVNFTTIIKLLAATLKRGHVAGASCDARSFEVNEKGKFERKVIEIELTRNFIYLFFLKISGKVLIFNLQISRARNLVSEMKAIEIE